ncbi:MAG TPA: hypothetical protein VIN59_01225 [Alphaproteobacteria bacterium]
MRALEDYTKNFCDFADGQIDKDDKISDDTRKRRKLIIEVFRRFDDMDPFEVNFMRAVSHRVDQIHLQIKSYNSSPDINYFSDLLATFNHRRAFLDALHKGQNKTPSMHLAYDRFNTKFRTLNGQFNLAAVKRVADAVTRHDHQKVYEELESAVERLFRATDPRLTPKAQERRPRY